jgi:hypothetical protein
LFLLYLFFILWFYFVALRNATMAIGRSRRPRGPTYARGANRSQFEDPELAVNARHLATRRAHPAFKFFTSLIPEAEGSIWRVLVPVQYRCSQVVRFVGTRRDHAVMPRLVL